MTRAAFKSTVRRRARSAPDAALDAVFDAWAGGSGCAARGAVEGNLASWRGSGGWDAGAVDRAALFGKATVLGGFAGVVVIDIIAACALFFFVQSIIMA